MTNQKNKKMWLPEYVCDWDNPLYDTLGEISEEALLMGDVDSLPLAKVLARLSVQADAMLGELGYTEEQKAELREKEADRLSRERIPFGDFF